MGGVMRVVTLANYLNKMGLEVFILTGKGRCYGYFGYDNIITQLNVKYIGKPDGFFEKELLKKDDVPKFKNILMKLLRISRSILNKFCIPDQNIFLINSFRKEALSIISLNDIKNVFISSPPHSMQLVGCKLKKDLKNSINIIADYRDSWNTRSIFKRKTYLGNLLNRMYERKVLVSCDEFTYVSEPMLDKIEKLHKIDIGNKSFLIMNGYNGIPLENESNSVMTDTQKIQVGYFGFVNSEKNSYLSILNLIDILIENSYLSEKFDFHFYGSIHLNHPKVPDLKGFHIYSPLSHKEALEKMEEMDYLMIVYSDPDSSDEVITGKFFEYISVRKPIICLAPQNMEAGRLVEKYKIGFHLDICNKESLKSGLFQLTKPVEGQFYSDLDISIFSRDIQYSKLLPLLN